MKNIRFLLWCGGIWCSLFFIFLISIPTKNDETTKVEAIVVFTGSKGRIQRAMELYERGLAPKLYISGLKSGESRYVLFDRYLPKTCLPENIDWDTAKNTHQNALETVDWLMENGIKTIRLVTASYHMPRSVLELHSKNKNLVILPYVIQEPVFLSQKNFLLYISEFHKTCGIVIKKIFKKTFI
jgi:uncharacterized SAM-binding protein YcdF (DUF218 family)